MSRSSKLTNEPKMVNAELFALTYGALVADMAADLASVDLVNAQLDKMGFNIGVRIADDLLAKNPNIGRCTDTHQIADILSKVALRNYLGIICHVQHSNLPANEFSLIFDNNPLVEFVEIPSNFSGLRYSQVICGAIQGALEALHLKVSAWLISDIPEQTEIRVKFERVIQEQVAAGDDD